MTARDELPEFDCAAGPVAMQAGSRHAGSLLASQPHRSCAQQGATVAVLLGFDTFGRPLLSIDGADPAVEALTTVDLAGAGPGTQVVVLWEFGPAGRAIIVGCLGPGIITGAQPGPDGTRVVSAERQLILRCGDASLTLTRAGKVLISGSYVLSRSSGANRIRGAVVELN